MKLFHFAVFSLVALSAVACGKLSSKPGTTETTSANMPKGGSCDEAKAGICTEYSDNPLGIAESACKSMFKGSYAKTSCPTANLMGVCEKKTDKGAAGDKEYYYFGNGIAPWVEDAKKDCENNVLSPGGKFTAQPNAEATAKEKGIPEAAKIVASCVKSDNTCDDIIGRMPELDKSFCEDGGGKFNDGKACDSANLVGSCLKHGKVSRYFTANLKSQTMKELQSDCESGFSEGHWYQGPNAPADKPAAAPAGKGAAKTGAPAAKPKGKK